MHKVILSHELSRYNKISMTQRKIRNSGVLRPSHYKLDTNKITNATEEDIYEINSVSSTKTHILMK